MTPFCAQELIYRMFTDFDVYGFLLASLSKGLLQVQRTMERLSLEAPQITRVLWTVFHWNRANPRAACFKQQLQKDKRTNSRGWSERETLTATWEETHWDTGNMLGYNGMPFLSIYFHRLILHGIALQLYHHCITPNCSVFGANAHMYIKYIRAYIIIQSFILSYWCNIIWQCFTHPSASQPSRNRVSTSFPTGIPMGHLGS